MFLQSVLYRPSILRARIAQMTAHLSNSFESSSVRSVLGVSLADLPKSNVFTSSLPPDPSFKTPAESHNAPRVNLGPRMVKDALYTFVHPEQTEEPELLGISQTAMRDIGLREGEEKSEEFKNLVAGNHIYWDNESAEGIYPWAQCYGGTLSARVLSKKIVDFALGWQLFVTRAISLFESTNPYTKTRYEIQLKGAGKTPYSRFADGKAVLRSSLREFVVSEALNALRIPTTRALSLTLAPKSRVRRETIETGAIVTRFAQSWLRVGTFDILRFRGNRKLIRTLATYVAEHVFPGWESLPAAVPISLPATSSTLHPARSVPAYEIQGDAPGEENRFSRLYREIARRNAVTVAYWQAYAFTNGVLNTDNTSLLGLSLDFGPFAFLDNFDPSYTPNHDDHMLRYCYKNQPSIIWWNLLRLGESLGELIGAGAEIDEEQFVNEGIREESVPQLIKRAETIIERTRKEYQAVFDAEFRRLMRARLGLVSDKETDFDELFSGLLDTMEALELDFNHFFRRLSSVRVTEIETEEQRKDLAARFFHKEGVTGLGNTEASARERIAEWLAKWRIRVQEDWHDMDKERETAMKKVNPKFIPRSWILDEVIQRVERGGEREIIGKVMKMALNPFDDEWDPGDRAQEERFCGDVPRGNRQMMCSCSS
ncbi:MAG: hypothetical protein Q9167_006714 [Letrouitia subvulpina]